MDGDNVCELCQRGPEDTLLGEMVRRDTSSIHTACLLLSSNVYLDPPKSIDINNDDFETLKVACLCSDPRQVKILNCDYFSRVSRLDALVQHSKHNNTCGICKIKGGTCT